MSRLCITCEHFRLDYDPGDGCPTCGYARRLEANCAMNNFCYESLMDSEATRSLRKLSKQAETCPDYQEAS